MVSRTRIFADAGASDPCRGVKTGWYPSIRWMAARVVVPVYSVAGVPFTSDGPIFVTRPARTPTTASGRTDARRSLTPTNSANSSAGTSDQGLAAAGPREMTSFLGLFRFVPVGTVQQDVPWNAVELYCAAVVSIILLGKEQKGGVFDPHVALYPARDTVDVRRLISPRSVVTTGSEPRVRRTPGRIFAQPKLGRGWSSKVREMLAERADSVAAMAEWANDCAPSWTGEGGLRVPAAVTK